MAATTRKGPRRAASAKRRRGTILVLHGPNLNLLGTREPAVYGHETLAEIKVHLSNVHAREPFRHHSCFADKAVGTIAGLGSRGYDFALAYAAAHLAK